MLREIILLGIGAFFGLGTTLMSLAAPQYFPERPVATWHWLFWGGLVLMGLMVLDAALLLMWSPNSERWISAASINAGIVLIAFGFILHYLPPAANVMAPQITQAGPQGGQGGISPFGNNGGSGGAGPVAGGGGQAGAVTRLPNGALIIEGGAGGGGAGPPGGTGGRGGGERGGEGASSVADKKSIIEAISNLLDQGNAIQQTFLEKNDERLIAQQQQEWAAQVDKFLRDHTDAGYAAQFASAPVVSVMPVGRSIVGGGYWAKIEGQKQALSNIISDIRHSN